MKSSQSIEILRMSVEVDSLHSKVAFLEERLENSVPRELYESVIAENDSLKAAYAALEERKASLEEENAQYKEMQTQIEAEKTDFKTLMEFWQSKHFAPSSETMTDKMNELVGKLPASKAGMLAEIAGFIARSKSEGWTTPVKKETENKNPEEKKTLRKRNGGTKERKSAVPRCIDVREVIGPDFSGMPPGYKVIMRKGREDTWVIEMIHIEKPRAYSRKYVIARCNVPGEDPMNSRYPKRLFEKIPVDPSFARFYLEMKFGYNLSEGRLLDMLGKMGCRIKQATLNRWMHIVMEGLYNELMPGMMKAVKSSKFTHNDETRILVRSEKKDGEGSEYKTEYIHGILSPEKNLFMMLYEKGERSHCVQKPIFEDSEILAFIADRCPVYAVLVNLFPNLVRGACWVHYRRYLLYAYLQDKRLERAVRLLAMLFEAEKIISKIPNLTEQKRVRERHAMCRPLVDAIFSIMETVVAEGADYGVLARRAAAYLLGDREGFTAFLSCGLLEIGNNAVERCFRHIAGGRDNWLQCGSHDAARHTAFMYSLVESCKMNGIDFGQYIETVLRRIQDGETDKASLLPNTILLDGDTAGQTVA